MKPIYVKVQFGKEVTYAYTFNGELDEITELFTTAIRHGQTLTLNASETGRIILDMSKALRVSVTSDYEERQFGIRTNDSDNPTLTLESVEIYS